MRLCWSSRPTSMREAARKSCCISRPGPREWGQRRGGGRTSHHVDGHGVLPGSARSCGKQCGKLMHRALGHAQTSRLSDSLDRARTRPALRDAGKLAQLVRHVEESRSRGRRERHPRTRGTFQSSGARGEVGGVAGSRQAICGACQTPQEVAMPMRDAMVGASTSRGRHAPRLRDERARLPHGRRACRRRPHGLCKSQGAPEAWREISLR